MTEALITEWLEEYAAVEPPQLRSFASEQEHNDEIVVGLYGVLEEKKKYSELIGPICDQLFAFYRSREVELQRFTLQFMPVLIRAYLGSVARGDKRSCRAVEALLIGIYNLEVVDETGQPKSVSFRMPSIAQASIYHEPMSLAPSFLTENALRRLEECNSKLVSWGPLPQVESLNAQNRLKVMTALMFVYNRQLSRYSKMALEYLCKVISKLVSQGFNRPGHIQRASYGSDSSGNHVPLRPTQRIPISSQLLLELLHAVYFAYFNGHEYTATQAIDSIHQRACYESYADAQLLANAIRHSLRNNATGGPSDKPMGISVAMSPSTATVSVSKSMITNASFRIKKLPDDIPIQTDKDDAGDGKNLVSISEEREDEVFAPEKGRVHKQSRDAGVPKSLPKLPTFSGLGKKLKERDVKATNKNGCASTDSSEITKKVTAVAAAKDTTKNTARNSLIGSVLNGDNEIEYSNQLTRKKSGGAPEQSNGPLALELNTKNGCVLPTETEKVSLVSDSLQSAVVSNSQSVATTESLSSSAVSVDSDIQVMDTAPLMSLREKESRTSMQVSSV